MRRTTHKKRSGGVVDVKAKAGVKGVILYAKANDPCGPGLGGSNRAPS